MEHLSSHLMVKCLRCWQHKQRKSSSPLSFTDFFHEGIFSFSSGLREVRFRKTRGISAGFASQNKIPEASRWSLPVFFLVFLRGLFSCRSSDLGLADLGEDTPLSQREGGTPISSQHLMVFLGGRPSPI